MFPFLTLENTKKAYPEMEHPSIQLMDNGNVNQSTAPPKSTYDFRRICHEMFHKVSISNNMIGSSSSTWPAWLILTDSGWNIS